ncbi:uncharacterized protein AMSG_11745 [Thecamonas trahens ATCC 50062]|uniref:Polymorphic outer membrane protein n=1 Tax=Thecamonas trahens ATCC 50062 TaxID=461836 RepID=A0A0L0D2Z6_THETB|nr:hypothetical protein AMSG_11745 [Thecamonas trahens ATCC 50062]KNC46669.1 hypothetical protein AMSG_11745 [Thecamonas trahens ATCC 50062]|eukprot:XP_013760494.1 hypothetical protein AMSG_11745 [Thecamonas trahens ATCC 50062]
MLHYHNIRQLAEPQLHVSCQNPGDVVVFSCGVGQDRSGRGPLFRITSQTLNQVFMVRDLTFAAPTAAATLAFDDAVFDVIVADSSTTVLVEDVAADGLSAHSLVTVASAASVMSVQLTWRRVSSQRTGAAPAPVLELNAPHSSSSFVVVLDAVDIRGASGPGAVAVSSASTSSCSLTVTDSIFDGNTGSAGGALAVTGCDVVVAASTFVNNSAAADGGAIVLTGGSAHSISTSVFEANSALGGSGGAIYTSGPLIATAVSFSANLATTTGGAVYAAGIGNLTLLATNASNNAAPSGGACVHGSATAWIVVSGASYLTFNTATAGPGGAAAAPRIDVHGGAVLSHNTAAGGSGSGGALACSAVCHVLGASLVSNVAAAHGGAVHVGDGARATLTSASFSSNFAAATGGAVAVANQIAAAPLGAPSLAVSDSSFTSNVANAPGSTGGAIDLGLLASASLGPLPSTFASNSAHAGGAIAYRHILVATGGDFSANSATATHGGAVLGVGTASSLDAADLSFVFNSAADAGGALYASGPVVLSSSTISHNSAGIVGGGLGFGATAAPTLLVDLSITSNVAGSGDGGGVHTTSTNVTSSRCTVIGNAAAMGNGGGMAVGGGGMFKLVDTTIANNTAVHGGAIFATAPAAGSDVVSSLITTNTATGTAPTAAIHFTTMGSVGFDASAVCSNYGLSCQPDL